MSLLIAPFWKSLLPASIRWGAFHSATQLSELFSVVFSIVRPKGPFIFRKLKILKTMFGCFRSRTVSSFHFANFYGLKNHFIFPSLSASTPPLESRWWPPSQKRSNPIFRPVSCRAIRGMIYIRDVWGY